MQRQRTRDVRHLSCGRYAPTSRSGSAATTGAQYVANVNVARVHCKVRRKKRRGSTSRASQMHGAGVIAKRGRVQDLRVSAERSEALDAAATMTPAGSVHLHFCCGIIGVPIHI
jgi:hypothetical protein